MKREQGVSLEGLSLFIKKVVELADEAGRAKAICRTYNQKRNLGQSSVIIPLL